MTNLITLSKHFGISAMLMLLASVQGVSAAFASGSMTMMQQREPYTIARANAAPSPAQNVASSDITGTITIAETGAGASHIQIDLHGCFLLTAGGSPRITFTDANGNFAFSNVDPGKNRLNYYPDYTPFSAYLADYYPIGGNNITVYVPDNATLPLNLQLALGGQVTGHVLSEIGTPLQDIEIVLTDAFGNTEYGSTDSTGNYVITGVPSGIYKVLHYPSLYGISTGFAYTLAGTIVVTAPATTANVNSVLVAGGSITGTITAADTGTPSVGRVVVYLENLDAKTDKTWQQPDYYNGTYRFSSLLPGHYRLYAWAVPDESPYMQTYYVNTMTATLATTITVSAGKTTTNIDIAMVKGGQVMGKVYGYGLLANPVQFVGVEVIDNIGRVVATGTTNSQGIYITYPGLPTGNYKVRFGNPSLGLCKEFSFGTQYYPGTTSLGAAVPVSVTALSITPNINADITLVLPRVYTPIIRR